MRNRGHPPASDWEVPPEPAAEEAAEETAEVACPHVEAADSREEAADIHAPPLAVEEAGEASLSRVVKTSIQLAGS